MPKKQTNRIYKRVRDGETRFYIDLRNLGGGREALIPEGEKRATTKYDLALVIAAARLAEIEKASDKSQRQKVLLKRTHVPEGLKAFAAQHLVKKAKGKKVTARWLEQTEKQLGVAVEFFGKNRALDSIEVADIEKYVEYLEVRPNGRGGTLSLGSQRHYLNSLSNLYKRAQAKVVGVQSGRRRHGEAGRRPRRGRVARGL